MSAAQAPATGAPADAVRAPLLSRVIAEIDPAHRCFLIDLGGLRSATLDRMQAFRCRFDVLDLDIGTLKQDKDEGALGKMQARLAERLPASGGESADLLLCWNYLNYFSRLEITALMEVILPRLSERARMHALVESSSPDMPSMPVPLALAEDGFVRVGGAAHEAPGSPRMAAPRHSTDGLLACMPGMIAEQTMLLGNGQKEYLFRRKP
jgi:hypothetical protein